MTDMTLEEAKKMHLCKMSKIFGNGNEERKYEKFFDTPDEEVSELNKEVNNFFDTVDEDESDQTSQSKRYPIDWRKFMTPVRDQGECGSCWAFAAAGVMEGNYNIKNKSSPTKWLSTQLLVDCDTKNNGCDGGWPYEALQFYGKPVGLLQDSEYP